jgi:hypothetical protein
MQQESADGGAQTRAAISCKFSKLRGYLEQRRIESVEKYCARRFVATYINTLL